MNQALNSKVIIFATILIGAVFLAVLIVSQSGKLSRNEQTVVDLAVRLELNKDQFLADLKSEETKNKVNSQKNDVLARIGGTPSTPQIFVNGVRPNLKTFDELETLLTTEAEKIVEGEGKVLLEVFSDYNCSACYTLEGYLNSLKETNTELFSKVDWQQKSLPFLNPNTSQLYAQAAEAARNQNKFFEYSNALFNMLHASL